MCYILFIHSYVDGHVGFFHLLATVNNSAMIMCIQMYFSDPTFSSFELHPEVRSMTHRIIYVELFKKPSYCLRCCTKPGQRTKRTTVRPHPSSNSCAQRATLSLSSVEALMGVPRSNKDIVTKSISMTPGDQWPGNAPQSSVLSETIYHYDSLGHIVIWFIL